MKFTAEEIEVLRLEARWARAKFQGDGLHPRRVYEEERYEFVTEYMRGAEPAGSEKQQKWLKKIKKEIGTRTTHNPPRRHEDTKDGKRAT